MATVNPDDLDSAIDALYQAPLDQFVALRNAQAADRRKAGDRAGAEQVKVLVKPTAVAWAVNQVWWRHRMLMQQLFDASAAQRAALDGRQAQDAAETRAAARSHAGAVAAVVDAAVAVLGSGATVTADVRHRLVGTVETLASGGWPGGTSPGRLTRELQPTGLEALGLLAALAGSVPADTSRRTTKPTLVEGRRGTKAAAAERQQQLREEQRADALAHLERLAVTLAAATEEVAAHATQEQQARAEADAAAARVAELETALDNARADARAARRAASAATAALGEAELRRARTAREVSAARTALDVLDGA